VPSVGFAYTAQIPLERGAGSGPNGKPVFDLSENRKLFFTERHTFPALAHAAPASMGRCLQIDFGSRMTGANIRPLAIRPWLIKLLARRSVGGSGG
jgi:hypothetical protein